MAQPQLSGEVPEHPPCFRIIYFYCQFQIKWGIRDSKSGSPVELAQQPFQDQKILDKIHHELMVYFVKNLLILKRLLSQFYRWPWLRISDAPFDLKLTVKIDDPETGRVFRHLPTELWLCHLASFMACVRLYSVQEVALSNLSPSVAALTRYILGFREIIYPYFGPSQRFPVD